jgi:threonine dehydratase
MQARRRIRDFIYETPLIPSREIGRDTRPVVQFKAENLQITGSFKIRGAASKMTSLSHTQPVVTASSGNHGIGAAQAATSIGQRLTVVLPETVKPAKLERIRSFDVDVILHGAETGLAEQHAQRLSTEKGFVYVSPYNDEEIVAGQGTIALELLEQSRRIDNVFVAMGGGGLISGIGSVLKSFSPATRVYGVSARNSAALAASITAGKVVETEHLDTLADAVAGGIDEGTITLGLSRAVIDEVLTCDEAEIERAMHDLLVREHMFVEGAAGLALAGFRQVAERCAGQNNVIILCGGNVGEAALNALASKR